MLGTCPACGGDVVESTKGYGCSNWQNGCSFTIWKTMARRKIPKTQVKKLLSNGESDLIKGFTSRAGKPFDARLKLEDNGVKFAF